ncbi:MAG: FAD-binding oxidoreductase [Actinomycetia bacterium]|jgi:sarcosine oxidase subunit beta|nr:FAD-binding oxidoreductase [Actinomycetes bacterium]
MLRTEPYVSAARDVVVVGAGVTGLSIALELAEAGLAPLVLERTGVAAEASGVQPGGVRQQWSTRISCELARESFGVYRELAARLDSDLPLEFDRCGYLFLAHSQPALAELEQSVARQNQAGVPSHLVTPEEAAVFAPGLDVSSVTGASWCSEDGYFDHPQAVVEAFAQAAQARGATLAIDEVTAIESDGAGWRLRLRTGVQVRAAHVVVAAGYDSPELLRPLGVELPIVREARHLFFSNPVPESILRPLVISSERHFAAKQLADGRVLASDLSAVGDPEEARPHWRQHLRETIEELLPILGYVSLPLLVTGFYDVTPDNQPVLGPIAGLEGLHLAAGFSGHGFMLAPAVGRIVAGPVLGRAPDEALERLSLDRFSNGSLTRELQTV